ncbi:MAG TPA: hypothetical protein VH479_19045 [Acidimicrobiales bacterium]|jgi:hypothetical protein
MPWCETCSRFLNPNTLEPDGSCPTCGRVVAEPAPEDAATGTGDTEVKKKAPWHFKILLAFIVVYLVFRFIQIGTWIFDWLVH